MSSYELQNKIVQKPVITLVLKTRYPKSKTPMYCVHCGGLLQFSYKEVRLIIQGVADIQEIQDEVQCRKCKSIYEIC